MKKLLEKLIDKENLTKQEAELLMEEMLQGNLTSLKIAAILTALRMKGETNEEISGFIKTMRKHMVKIRTEGLVIDTCGTGGDGSGTFNISTATALVVAGTGVKVAKHGNRSASGKCGSADVLEELGVNINLSQKQVEELLSRIGITFLFAPLFHPSMKNVAPVRCELKIRTVFNFLGPLVNPAAVVRQLIGVPNREIAEKLAQVATNFDYQHLLIVTSTDGLDEISISAPTHYFEVKGRSIKRGIIKPEDFGIKKVSTREIQGGVRGKNAAIIRRILQGEKSPRRDIVTLNSAAALYVAGKVKNIFQAIKKAKQAIDSGRAREVLEKFIKMSNVY